MPKTQWEDTESLTPFARLIRDYMWNHRPPLNPHSFAELVGVRSSTVAKWRDGVIPDADTMDLIAERTAMNVLRLYEAAGYVTPQDAFDYLSERVETSPILDADSRQRIQQHIGELRAQYEAREEDRGSSNDERCRASS